MVLCCSGFMSFEEESRSENLWVPKDTKAQDDLKMYSSYFPREGRINQVILEAKGNENVFSKTVLLEAMDIHLSIMDLSVEDSEGTKHTLVDLCIIKDEGASQPCMITSILDLWNYDKETLQNDSDPLATVNNSGKDLQELQQTVGGIQTNSNGDFTSAKALSIMYFLANNDKLVGGSYVDEEAENWEMEFLDLTRNIKSDLISVYPEATISMDEEFGGAIQGDIGLMSTGYIIMLVYLALNLGRLRDRVEARIGLSAAGLICIGMSIGASYGLSAGLGFFFTPLHTILPFILLGLGIDDSFVIAGAYEQVKGAKDVPERVALALSHAGVSITITSVTDFVAFLLSTASSLPALTSFCLYAAMGILFLFLFQISFFSACLTIDSKRIEAQRYDILCCAKRKTADQRSPTTETEKSFLSKFLGGAYSRALLNPVVSVAVCLGFVAVFVVGAVGTNQLSVQDSSRSFIPDGSYLLDTMDKQDQYFGEQGPKVEIVTLGMDYFQEQAFLADIRTRLEGLEDRSPYIRDTNGPTFSSWYDSYIDWLGALGPNDPNLLLDSSGRPTDEDQFYQYLQTYLDGPGARYRTHVKFEGGSSATRTIVAARMEAEYVSFAKYKDGRLQEDAEKEVQAMDDTRSIVEGWENPTFPWSFNYLSWEVFKIIKGELTQGITLCLVAVFALTLVLLAHPLTAFLVVLSVAMTIIDVMGVMYYWDLVIDNVSVIMLVLAVGLSVDYAAHVAHCFMLKSGTRRERVALTLGDIGPAVLNGGFSTFLAVVLLSGSSSYVFRVIFKQFFATVVLGMGHGLIFLPILLSWIGPAPYASAAEGHGPHKSESADGESVSQIQVQQIQPAEPALPAPSDV